MHFTREPIIESVIAAKEGYKLVVRNSKAPHHEEFLVDAVEIVSFGGAMFFRCLEKPRVFLAPASDYEIVEARETRTPLKAVPQERVIKIAGGKESGPREQKTRAQEEAPAVEERTEAEAQDGGEAGGDRRKRRRRRRGRGERDDEGMIATGAEEKSDGTQEEVSELHAVAQSLAEPTADVSAPVKAEAAPSLLPPPSVLISETLSRYREGKAPKREETSTAGDQVGFFAETTEESFEDPEA